MNSESILRKVYTPSCDSEVSGIALAALSKGFSPGNAADRSKSLGSPSVSRYVGVIVYVLYHILYKNDPKMSGELCIITVILIVNVSFDGKGLSVCPKYLFFSFYFLPCGWWRARSGSHVAYMCPLGEPYK